MTMKEEKVSIKTEQVTSTEAIKSETLIKEEALAFNAVEAPTLSTDETSSGQSNLPAVKQEDEGKGLFRMKVKGGGNAKRNIRQAF